MADPTDLMATVAIPWVGSRLNRSTVAGLGEVFRATMVGEPPGKILFKRRVRQIVP